MSAKPKKRKQQTKESKIQKLEENQCSHCFSTIFQEAEYYKDSKIIRICDQCHSWDEKGKSYPILDS